MALTDTQRSSVRYYLGYSDTSAGLYSLLEGRMSSLSSEGEARVTTQLTRLDAIETELAAVVTFQKVSRAEEVTLRGPDGVRSVRAEGQRLVRGLAAILDVAVNVDIFSSGSGSGVARRGA